MTSIRVKLTNYYENANYFNYYETNEFSSLTVVAQ